MLPTLSSRRPRLMGILNVTPDSFSDGGKFFSVERALAHAKKMIREGADIIDIGGESSGPGSIVVPLQEELRRVIPVIKKLSNLRTTRPTPRLPRPGGGTPSFVLSIDTYKSEVARQAIAAGARIVNDVTALRGDKKMASVIAESGVSVILMYSKDKTARTTRTKKNYRDVVKTIVDFLEKRIAYARANGIKKSQIIIDPGMGAFVSGEPQYSYEILRRLREFKKLGLPILVGASRKSFLSGKIQERLTPTLLAHAVAAMNGADVIRAHDVRQHFTFLACLGHSRSREAS